MSAVICVAQHKHGCVHVATDALSYTRDQVPSEFGPKIFSVPHWPGVVTCVGACSAMLLLAPALAAEFTNIDDLRTRGDALLPKLVNDWRALLTEMGSPPTGSEIIIAGISAHGPAVYAFRTDDSLPPDTTPEEAAASPYRASLPAQLVELPANIETPIPMDQIIPANWEGFDLDADTDLVHWQIKKLLTMQRHMQLPAGIGGIGGFGQVATIHADRIEQRILCRWDDKLGAPLRPEPIDWERWHKENPRPTQARKSVLRVVR